MHQRYGNLAWQCSSGIGISNRRGEEIKQRIIKGIEKKISWRRNQRKTQRRLSAAKKKKKKKKKKLA